VLSGHFRRRQSFVNVPFLCPVSCVIAHCHHHNLIYSFQTLAERVKEKDVKIKSAKIVL
jgi:hypothetical protein